MCVYLEESNRPEGKKMKHWARKLLGIVLCAAALLMVCGAEAGGHKEIDGISYSFNSDGTATVTSNYLTASHKIIVIPDTVSDFEGNQYTVNEIYSYAFNSNTNLEEITIPASIKIIGARAFFGCSNLNKVIFNEGSKLTTIEEFAFSDCTILSSINIPASVTSISESAFFNTSIDAVTIPASVTSIGRSAFAQTPYVTFLSAGTSTQCTLVGSSFSSLTAGNQLTIKQTNDGHGTTQLVYDDRNDNMLGTLSYSPAAGYAFSSVSVKLGDTELDVSNNQFSMHDCMNGGTLTIDAKFTADSATAPIVNTQPSISLTYGYTTGNELAVAATAATDTTYKPLEYQWYSCDDTNKTNAQKITTDGTSATYTVPLGENVGTKYYYCEVTATRADNDATATANSEVVSVTIDKADLTITAKDQSYEYDGDPHGEGDPAYDNPAEIATKVDVDGLKNSDTITSIILDGSETKIGIYSGKIVPSNVAIGPNGSATKNYSINYVAGTLTITAPKMAITVNGDSGTLVYNGKEQTYTGTVTATSADAAFDASKFSYNGSVAVKGKDVGGYTTQLNKDDCKYSDIFHTADWTIGNPISLTITPKSIAGATVSLDKTQLTYNGSEQTVNVTGVTIDGLSLTSADYEVTGNKGTDKGTYTVTVKGKGNYQDTATAEWSIVEKAMTVSAAGYDGVYDGQPHGITVSVTDPESGAAVKYGTAAGTYDLDASPTLTDAGTMTVYFKATADNYTDYTGSAVVTISDPVHVHTPEKIPGKAATCTEDGLTDGEKCSTCGAILTAQKVIPATGHKPDDGTVTREPTASEPGIRTYCCTVCGAKLYDEEIPYTVYLGWTGWKLVNGGWYYGDSAGYALIGTHAVDGVVYHFGDTGEMVSGWKELNGKWFHATTSGALSYGGWEKIGGVWYYFRENGEMATGWVNDRGTWYYLRDNGSMAVGWVQGNGKWYYTDKNGAMRTGWLKDGNIWYYLADDGHMVTEGSGFRPSGETGVGWVQDGGRWYYVGNNGGMATGWLWDGENWYYLDKNGAMVTGWLKDGKTWYYLHADGKMTTGWLNDGGVWYYLRDNGAMATGWLLDEGEWYYLNSNGAMMTGWVKDAKKWYYLQPDGKMATGWITDGGLIYYLRDSGAMATGWICVDDYWYYMNPNGAMVTGWLKDGNTWYWLDSEGHMVTGEVMIDGQINVFADSGAWLYAQ